MAGARVRRLSLPAPSFRAIGRRPMIVASEVYQDRAQTDAAGRRDGFAHGAPSSAAGG